jgi:hypothetical protein
VKLEGNNTPFIHFPVPIIQIDKLFLNESDELAIEAYQVFNSRVLPDDRRNPKIMLIQNNKTIFEGTGTTLYFYRGFITTIEGSFGYLESDGSTPAAIQWITGKLVIQQLSSDASPFILKKDIKRERVDLHETEYETEVKTASSEIQTKMSGDSEIDRLLQLYKAPLAIGGTVPTVFKSYTMFTSEMTEL